MTVADLIEALKQMPQDSKVIVEFHERDGYFNDAKAKKVVSFQKTREVVIQTRPARAKL